MKTNRVEIVLCPPVILMPAVAEVLGSGARVAIGAQNFHPQSPGAYTGEIAAAMLLDFGCRFVIVGHSERRTLFGETDDLVAAKAGFAMESGITPIVCVGETLEERRAGATESVVLTQLRWVLETVAPEHFAGAVIAYEPVWAIGTGQTASPEQAQVVHRLLRTELARYDADLAQQTRILYGGSVKADNAGSLFAQPDIDGGLIGGASLDPYEFLAICQAAE